MCLDDDAAAGGPTNSPFAPPLPPPLPTLFVDSVYAAKTWNCLLTQTSHKGAINGVRFGPDAHFLTSVSDDHTLKFFGTA